MIPIVKVMIGEEERAAVLNVMDSGILAQGDVVAEFEKRFAEFIGVKHAIATSSGTTALHAALAANGIKPGDEVITSPFTFIASANSIRMTGARPVFVDIDETTMNLDPKHVEKAVCSKTKAVMPVHLYGLSVDMDPILDISKKYNLKLIEDACQAHEATYKGKRVGSFGTGCFSFYATKNMATGEGGMLTTADDDVSAAARKCIHHGSSERYHHDMMGYNYRMTNLSAAIGLEQLKKLSLFNSKRRENAAYLSERLKSIRGIVVPDVSDGHVFHQYTIRISKECKKTRDEVRDLLNEKGVGSAIFYPLPVHKQITYADYSSTVLPVAERVSREVLSLPVHPALKKDDLDTIINAFSDLNL